MLNQRAFDAVRDEVYFGHVCVKVSRILDLSEDKYISPSNRLNQHVLRWTFMALSDRWAALQWRYKMREKLKKCYIDDTVAGWCR